MKGEEEHKIQSLDEKVNHTIEEVLGRISGVEETLQNLQVKVKDRPFSLSGVPSLSRHQRANGGSSFCKGPEGLWYKRSDLPDTKLYMMPLTTPKCAKLEPVHPSIGTVMIIQITQSELNRQLETMRRELIEMWSKVKKQNNRSVQTKPFSFSFNFWNWGERGHISPQCPKPIEKEKQERWEKRRQNNQNYQRKPSTQFWRCWKGILSAFQNCKNLRWRP